MDSLLNEQLLTTTVHISMRKLSKTKNIDGLISHELKDRIEGLCGKEGYIIKGSIFVVQRSIGKVITINSESNIQYEITYKLKSILPCKGDIYHCIIDSISKMGLIAYLDFTDEGTDEGTDGTEVTLKNSPLLIIIPNEYLQVDKTIEDYEINKKIIVSVLDSRIKYQASQIQVIGKVVDTID